MALLKRFLPVLESKLSTLLLQYFAKLRRPAEEDRHSSLPLLVKLLEDSVPVWSPSHGSGLQSRDEVALGLQIKNIIFLVNKHYSQ